MIGSKAVLALWIGTTLAAHAATYQYSISSPDGTKLALVKNCVDYSACLLPNLILNPQAGRSHLRVQLPTDQDAKNFFRFCDFRHQNTEVLLFNESTRKESRSTDADVAPLLDQFATLPNLYVPSLSAEEKVRLASTVTALIRANKQLEAIQHIVRTLHLDTYSYRFESTPSLGTVAITTHETKLIRIGSYYFSDPCQLTRVIRHELEHVSQMKRANQCKSAGLPNRLDDHMERERSAYLNDIANASRYCGNPATTKHIINNAWIQMKDRYLRKPLPATHE
jgi:hypothetical protein